MPISVTHDETISTSAAKSPRITAKRPTSPALSTVMIFQVGVSLEHAEAQTASLRSPFVRS